MKKRNKQNELIQIEYEYVLPDLEYNIPDLKYDILNLNYNIPDLDISNIYFNYPENLTKPDFKKRKVKKRNK